MKVFVIAAIFIGLLVPTVAQQQSQVELTDPEASIAVLGITVEQAIGSDVIDTEGKPLGTVIRVLGDDADSPTAIVLSSSGSELTIKLDATELINNRIVANKSGEPIENQAPFE